MISHSCEIGPRFCNQPTRSQAPSFAPSIDNRSVQPDRPANVKNKRLRTIMILEIGDKTGLLFPYFVWSNHANDDYVHCVGETWDMDI